MPPVHVLELEPNQRFALVGKSRSGKTTFATLLACRLIPKDPKQAKGWECWWIDTKGDPRDHRRLMSWGFSTHNGPRRLIKIPFEEGNPQATIDAVNKICYRALKRGGVLLVIDEYRHCVQSTRRASPGILHVHQRGGGLDVGLIGQTQEPVDIPRQLVSQANHVVLHDLSYPYDLKFAKDLYPRYRRPRDRGSRFGFYWGAIDGDGSWVYYPHQVAWDRHRAGLMAQDADDRQGVTTGR